MDKKLKIIRLIAALYRTGKITTVQKNNLANSLSKTQIGKPETFKGFFKIVTTELDEKEPFVREITSMVLELSTL